MAEENDQNPGDFGFVLFFIPLFTFWRTFKVSVIKLKIKILLDRIFAKMHIDANFNIKAK
jgi:hypothetical protein